MHDLLPSFTVLHESFGYLLDGVAPDGEDDSVCSFESEEGTEIEISQRRNAERLNDVLGDVFPG